MHFVLKSLFVDLLGRVRSLFAAEVASEDVARIDHELDFKQAEVALDKGVDVVGPDAEERVVLKALGRGPVLDFVVFCPIMGALPLNLFLDEFTLQPRHGLLDLFLARNRSLHPRMFFDLLQCWPLEVVVADHSDDQVLELIGKGICLVLDYVLNIQMVAVQLVE